MTTENRARRYRAGFAAGYRAGSAVLNDHKAPVMRSLTGDDEADAGYSDGFQRGGHVHHGGSLSGFTRVIRDVFWSSLVSRWHQRPYVHS